MSRGLRDLEFQLGATPLAHRRGNGGHHRSLENPVSRREWSIDDQRTRFAFGGEIHVLPALPKDWSEGYVDGLKVRGGAELSLRWKDNALQSLTVKGPVNAEFVVRYGDTRRPLRLDDKGHASWA